MRMSTLYIMVLFIQQGSGKEEGICAKVRVRIVQELVLTRDAFNARLEMENGENSDLENIKVEIIITQTYGTGDPANGVFSIGKVSWAFLIFIFIFCI